MLTLISLVVLSSLTDVQAASEQALPADPPERAARVSEATGELLLLAGGETEWAPLERNRPLIVGDTVFTQGDARSEIDLGTGRLWLDYASGVAFSQFDPAEVGVVMQQGSLRFKKRSVSDSISVSFADKRSVQLVIGGRSSGRVDLRSDGRITVTIDEGSAQFKLGEFSYALQEGETALLNSGSVRVISDVRTQDGFDEWASSHGTIDSGESDSDHYVSPTVAGRDDLERYGTWQTTDDYGAVWFPTNVAANWAPYRDGHWVSTAAYGWTWVDRAPWGYAPFHYGRWTQIGSRWGWCPGARGMHVAFAPALVVFVNLANAAGVVSWAPLGYNQSYLPAYQCSAACYGAINRPFHQGRPVEAGTVGLPGLTTVARDSFRDSRAIRDAVLSAKPPTSGVSVLNGAPIAPPHAQANVHAAITRPQLVMTRVTPPPTLQPRHMPTLQTQTVQTPTFQTPRFSSPSPLPMRGPPGHGSFEVITPSRPNVGAMPSFPTTARPANDRPEWAHPTIAPSVAWPGAVRPNGVSLPVASPVSSPIATQITRPSNPMPVFQPSQIVRPSQPVFAGTPSQHVVPQTQMPRPQAQFPQMMPHFQPQIQPQIHMPAPVVQPRPVSMPRSVQMPMPSPAGHVHSPRGR